MPGSISRYLALTKKNLIRFFKNPKALGFMLIIPVMYYTIMGTIFGGIDGGAVSVNYKIGWVDNDSSKGYMMIPSYPSPINVSYPIENISYNVLNEIDEMNVINYTSIEGAKKAQINETIVAFVYFPEGYERSISRVWQDKQDKPMNYSIYFLQTVSPQTKAIVSQFVASIIGGVVNYRPDYMNITYTENSTVGHEVNQISYQAPGLILYGPMTMITFAIIVITSEKKDGIFKRLSSSEVKNHEIILSSITMNIILVFMQFAIAVVILLIFGWEPIIYSLWDAIIGLFLTMLVFSFFLLALAFAVCPILKDPETAGGGVWIILIPLMMLSGIFVPLEIMGETMQDIAKVLPTRYAVLLMNNLLLNGLPISSPEFLTNLGILSIFSIVILLIGIKAFSKFKN